MKQNTWNTYTDMHEGLSKIWAEWVSSLFSMSSILHLLKKLSILAVFLFTNSLLNLHQLAFHPHYSHVKITSDLHIVNCIWQISSIKHSVTSLSKDAFLHLASRSLHLFCFFFYLSSYLICSFIFTILKRCPGKIILLQPRLFSFSHVLNLSAYLIDFALDQFLPNYKTNILIQSIVVSCQIIGRALSALTL